MEAFWLFAVGIDAVRDVFRADEALSERLRGIAAERFHAPRASNTGSSLLSRLGPLLRRQPATEVDPSQPLASDVRAMLAGGYIPPERTAVGWRLLIVWLLELSSWSQRLDVDDLDGLDFDLARAGLASQYSLRGLAGRPLGIPLQPDRGRLAGYCKHLQAAETLRALQRLAETTSPEFAPVLARTFGFRRGLEAVAGNPALDLVVIEDRS